MSEPTVADVKALLELQDVEARLRRKHHLLDSLPEQVALDAVLAEVEVSRDRAAGLRLELDKARSVVTRQEKELRLLRERLTVEEQRLYSGAITEARALKSADLEIATTKLHIDDHETTELEALVSVDEIEVRAAAEAAEEARLMDVAQQAEAARDEAAKVTLADIAQLEVDRDALRDDIANTLLRPYDAVMARGEGRAVGELDGDLCTACGVSLPAVQVNKLHREGPLTTCPCDRELLLVVER